MAGLIGDADGGENAPTHGGDQTFSTTDAASQSPPAESHLDSFFAGSGWTREDVMLLAVLVQALILMVWFVEVRNA